MWGTDFEKSKKAHMTKIRVKNFGFIKEGPLDKDGHDGWIEIKKVTAFTGSEGSGMSALTKLISTLTWIEKALVRGDYPEREFSATASIQINRRSH